MEYLEYEWPDLPPIIDIKNAITRSRVSKGMDYVLPVDKGKGSVENVYRTDLRVMFQEPYLSNGNSYNEERLKSSVSHHMKTNTVPTPFKEKHSDYTRYKLNHESERVRRMFSHSAPPGGLTGKAVTPESKCLQPRSKLYIPLKTKLPQEAIKLKEEADTILKSVQEDRDKYDPSRDHDLRNQIGEQIDPLLFSMPNNNLNPETHTGQVRIGQQKSKVFFKKTDRFKDYETLKNTKPPAKPAFPEDIRSPFLTQDKNMQIWSWLTHDDVITEFSYFMSICS